MTFSNYKFHCSSLGRLMTASKDKKDPIGETCKALLIECYIEETYGRSKQIVSRFLERGTKSEEDGITLYSTQTQYFYKKNTELLENDYICGTPDIYKGTDIRHATAIKDIKCPWDIFTFFSVMHKPINPHYVWQINGYEELAKCEEGGLVYTLVPTPDEIIEKEINRIKWEKAITDPDAHPEFLELAEYLRSTMKYEDISEKDRWVEFVVNRNTPKMETCYEKIELCRKVLNSL